MVFTFLSLNENKLLLKFDTRFMLIFSPLIANNYRYAPTGKNWIVGILIHFE